MRALILAFVVAHAAGNRAAARYIIDLSTAPEHRWDHIITSDGNNASLWKAIAAVEANPEFGVLLKLAAKIPFTKLSGWMPAEQAAEVSGIERLTKLPSGVLWAVNALYDITAGDHDPHHACTSLVTQAADGTISHGRNLDYPLGKAMQSITMAIDWRAHADANATFTSVGFLGQVGFNTVVRHGAWGLSHDERDLGALTEDWVDVFLRRRVLTFSFIRQLAQTAPTFATAVKTASSTDLSAASYFVLSGTAPGEGALITRDRDAHAAGATDVYRLDAAAGRWYLLETNYDHSKPTSPTDDRRAVAQRAFARAGRARAASVDGLVAILSDNAHCNTTAGERPVLNSHTVYTAAFSAAVPGSLQVIVRDPPSVDACSH